MDFFVLFVVLNVLCTAAIFAWVWLLANKNKDAFFEKLNNLDKKVDGIDGEMSVSINTSSDFNEGLLSQLKNIQNDFVEMQEAFVQTKEISKKVSDQHEEYHDGMLQKLNQAGELIVGYETFFENSLVELEDLSRFVDVLSKRPAVSSDPDFTSFVRAVQVMVQILSRYSAVAADLKKESQVTKNE